MTGHSPGSWSARTACGDGGAGARSLACGLGAPGRPPLHIAHVSTAAGVALLRDWADGPSAETAPHYLALTAGRSALMAPTPR